MPFFQPAFLPTEANFFHQLLSELDQSEQPKTCGPRRHARPQPQETFTPRFDVAETSSSYELFGEVAGLEQEALSIEFSDAQTLIIKGQTQRAVPATQATAVTASSPTPQPEAEANSDASSEKSHNVTVEDEYDEADTPLATPATAATTTATVAESQPQQAEKQQQAQAPKPRFWVSERRVGSFARSFSFSQRIEQDEVTASLKNGVLHVVVPKSVKSRKVAVNVN